MRRPGSPTGARWCGMARTSAETRPRAMTTAHCGAGRLRGGRRHPPACVFPTSAAIAPCGDDRARQRDGAAHCLRHPRLDCAAGVRRPTSATAPPRLSLPADFKRMLMTSNVWRRLTTTPMRFISDPDEWLQRRAQQLPTARGEWNAAAARTISDPALVRRRHGANSRTSTTTASRGRAAAGDIPGRRRHLPARRAAAQARHDLAMEGQQGPPYAEDMGDYGDALAMPGPRQPVADHHRPAAGLGQCARRLPVAGAERIHHMSMREQIAGVAGAARPAGAAGG